MMGRQILLALTLMVAVVVLVAGPAGKKSETAPSGSISAGRAVTSAGCDMYASQSGSDLSGDGQLGMPYRSVAKLDASLAPGQTGCLRAGTYGDTSTVHDLDNSGTSARDITITAYPGEQAKLVGLVDLRGSYTVLSGLDIDGSNTAYASQRAGTICPYPVSNGLEIDGHDDIFQYNNFYQSVPSLRGNGIGIGWNEQADRTIVRYNRIHDLGQCDAYDQMIYLAHGNGVQIYDNWMWSDPHGWGVQVYPAASDAHIYDNVIDAAGSGFIIGGPSNVSRNVIDHNVVMNSTGLPDATLPEGVGISSCCGVGSGNVFESNDVFNSPGGVGNATGISVVGNTSVNPGLEDPDAHDYRVASGSALANWGLWDGGGQGYTGTTMAGRRAFIRPTPGSDQADSPGHITVRQTPAVGAPP